MATSKDEIRRWILQAQKEKAHHLIVVCDTYDWEDFPVEVFADVDMQEEIKKHQGRNMEKVMEVYSMTGKYDIEEQLKEHRAWHLD